MVDKKLPKKALIVTYYWPPAGGPGVQRWLKFVKYLRDYNIEPTVYVPSNPTYPLVDKLLEKDIPKGLRVLKQPIFEPYKLASVLSKKGTNSMSRGLIREKEQGLAEKILLWIRGNIFVPDARKYWVKPSVRFLRKIIQEENADVLITTGPPHSLHLIGLKLKALTGVKWIADFRDPWTGIGYHDKLKPGKRAQRIHETLEKEVLTRADAVIATSYTTAKEFEAIAGRKVHTITNGFDDVDRVSYPPSDKFCMSHIGSLLTGRDPKILWEALAELCEEIPDFAGDLEIKLVGAVSEDVLGSVKMAGLNPYMQRVGYVSHEEALRLQQEARVLLLLEIDAGYTRGIIPGKLFEYMAAQRPVLAIGPSGWEAGSILKETGAGSVFTYKEKEALKSKIEFLYRDFNNKVEAAENKAIEKYSRKALTGELARIINRI